MQVIYNGKKIRLKTYQQPYSQVPSRKGYEIWSTESDWSDRLFHIQVCLESGSSKFWKYKIETNGERISFRDENGDDIDEVTYKTPQEAALAAIDALMEYRQKFNKVIADIFGEVV